jgi:hypothetical protein
VGGGMEKRKDRNAGRSGRNEREEKKKKVLTRE